MKILLGESSKSLSELKIVDLTIFSFLSDFHFITGNIVESFLLE